MSPEFNLQKVLKDSGQINQFLLGESNTNIIGDGNAKNFVDNKNEEKGEGSEGNKENQGKDSSVELRFLDGVDESKIPTFHKLKDLNKMDIEKINKNNDLRSTQLSFQDVLTIKVPNIDIATIKGVWSSDNVCIVINNEVLIFNIKLTQHLAIINVGELITFITFSDNQSFLLIGDQLGTIHFIHIPTASLLYSQNICGNDSENIPINWISAVYSPFSGQEEVLIVTGNNHLIRISNLQFAALETALAMEDFILVETLYKQTHIEDIDLDVYGVRGFECATFSCMTESIYLAGETGSVFPLVILGRPLASGKTTLLDHISLPLEGKSIRKLECHPTQYKMFSLTDDKKLMIWDLYSLVHVQTLESDLVLDFQILGSSTTVSSIDSLNTSTFYLILITENSISEENRIEIRDVNTTALLYSWTVPKGIVLFDSMLYQGGGALLTMAYNMKKGDTDKDESKDLINKLLNHDTDINGKTAILLRKLGNELVISNISESVAIQKYHQLITGNNFAAALEFAIQSNLDLQVLYRHQLDTILEQSHGKSLSECNIVYEDICEMIKNINDISFMCEFCQSIAFNDIDKIYSLHKFVENILNLKERQLDTIDYEKSNAIETESSSSDLKDDIIESNSSKIQFTYTHIQSLRRDIQTSIHKLGTFKLISNLELHCNSDEYYSVGMEWNKFNTFAIPSYVIECLRNNQLQSVNIVWTRHRLECILGRAFEGFSELPIDADINLVGDILINHVIPALTNEDDKFMFLLWFKERISLLDKLGSMKALQFTSILFRNAKTLKFVNSSKTRYSFFDSVTPHSYINTITLGANNVNVGSCILGLGSEDFNKRVYEIFNLYEALQDIVFLSDDCGFTIFLDEYKALSKSDIAKRLLDTVAVPDLIGECIKFNFKSYTERNSLDSDTILMEYCNEILDDMMTNAAIDSQFIDKNIFISKVTAIYSGINNENMKADVVLQLMRTTPIPWENELNELFEDSLSKSIKRKNELEAQYTLLKLKRMLLNYKIDDFDIGNRNQAKKLLPIILSRIDVENALEDAMLVLKAYNNISSMDVYKTRISYLLDENKFDIIKQLMNPSSKYFNNFSNDQRLCKTEYNAILEELYHWKEYELKLCLISNQDIKQKSPTYIKVTKQLICLVECSKEIEQLNSKDFHKSTANENIPINKNYTVFYDADIILKLLNCLLGLAIEFNLLYSLNDIDTEPKRLNILKSYGLEENNNKDISSSKKGKGKSSISIGFDKFDEMKHIAAGLKSNLGRLGEILLFRRSFILQHLAIESAKTGNIQLALSLGKEMLIDSDDEGLVNTLQELIINISSHVSNEQFWQLKSNQTIVKDITKVVREFSQYILCKCEDGNLPNAIGTFAWADLQHSIFCQSSSGNFGAAVTSNIAVNENTTNYTNSFVLTPEILISTLNEDSWSNHIIETKAFANMYKTEGEGNKKDISTIFQDTHLNRSFILDTSVVLPMIFKLNIGCSKIMDTFKNTNKILADNMVMDFDNSFDEIIFSCKDLIEYLVKYNSPRTSLQVLFLSLATIFQFPEILDGPDGDEIIRSSEKLFRLAINKLASDAMSSKNIDRVLIMGCLLSLPMKDAFEVFKSGITTAGFAFSRLISISAVGIVVGTIWKQRAFKVSCEDLANNARWWQLLSVYGIPFRKEDFKYGQETNGIQREIIPTLLRRTQFDIYTCLEFAHSYDIEDDFIYLEFIRAIFLNKADFGNYGEYIIGIIENIVNKKKLYNTLTKECLVGISPYDYERISCLGNLILYIEPKDELGRSCKSIVDTIKDYKRLSKPSMNELLEARRLILSKSKIGETILCPSGSNYIDNDNALIKQGKEVPLINETYIPPIFSMNESELAATNETELYNQLIDAFPDSLARLPYHLLVLNPWSLLSGEVSESTLLRLKPLRRILGLDSDSFYILTLDKMIEGDDSAVEKELNTLGKLQEGLIIPPNSSESHNCNVSFKDARKILSHISNKVTAISASLKLASKYPTGYDRIHSNVFAYNTARAVLNNDSKYKVKEITPELVETLKRKMIFSQIENHLASNDLKDYIVKIDLENDEEEVLRLLYEEKSHLGLSSTLKLHTVVDEICAVLGKDPDKFRNDLIFSLLDENIDLPKHIGLFQEDSLPSTRIQIFSSTESNKHVQLKYLLSSMTISEAAESILSYSSRPEAQVRTLNRIRALRVLFDIAPMTIMNLNEGDDILSYFQMLLYLADFEELQVPQTLREFASCDKKAFARSLWLQYPENEKCIQLICNICIDYNISDSSIWDMALQRLSKGKNLSYLLGLFTSLIDSESLVTVSQLPYLPVLWTNVILQILLQCEKYLEEHNSEKADNPEKKLKLDNGTTSNKYNRTSGKIDDYNRDDITIIIEKSIGLITKCPFLSELKIEPLMGLLNKIQSKYTFLNESSWLNLLSK